MAASEPNTLFLRLEGPMQSWGIGSMWVIRDSALEPSKSGVIGLLACALGRTRTEPVQDLAAFHMGVRVDRPGILTRDYHTVGAKIGVMSAEGKRKITQATGEYETLVSERFYLSDAAFLVALRATGTLLDKVRDALTDPRWPPFLGRKSCPPSVPLFAGIGSYPNLIAALASQAWSPRLPEVDYPPERLRYVTETTAADPEAFIRYDDPLAFSPPSYQARHVREDALPLSAEAIGVQTQPSFKRPERERMNYRSRAWKEKRNVRSREDKYLCVFCRLPSAIVHHVTYARANREIMDDLRSVCRLCHDAITMLEYEGAFAKERIDPFSGTYRNLILAKRLDILKNRTKPHLRARRD